MNPPGKALGVAVCDIDGDGRIDLVVANDTSPNNLYRNEKTVNGIPMFKDVAIEAGVAVGEDGRARGAMGVAFGGHEERDGLDARDRQLLERDVVRLWTEPRATSSWTSRPERHRADVSPRAHLRRRFADVDLDGVLDLLVANGHVETTRAGRPAGRDLPRRRRSSTDAGAGRFRAWARRRRSLEPIVGRGRRTPISTGTATST